MKKYRSILIWLLLSAIYVGLVWWLIDDNEDLKSVILKTKTVDCKPRQDSILDIVPILEHSKLQK